MRKTLSILGILLLVMLSSCTDKVEKQLQGEWLISENMEDGMSADMSLTFEGSKIKMHANILSNDINFMSIALNGDYTVVDDNKLEISFSKEGFEFTPSEQFKMLMDLGGVSVDVMKQEMYDHFTTSKTILDIVEISEMTLSLKDETGQVAEFKRK